MDYQEFQAKKERSKVLKLAAVRTGPMIGFHLLCAPVASVVYATKTGEWLPTAAGTGVFVFGLPFALFDLGLTALIGSCAASCILFANKANESRMRLGLFHPYQADEMIMKDWKENYPVNPPTVEE